MHKAHTHTPIKIRSLDAAAHQPAAAPLVVISVLVVARGAVLRVAHFEVQRRELDGPVLGA